MVLLLHKLLRVGPPATECMARLPTTLGPAMWACLAFVTSVAVLDVGLHCQDAHRGRSFEIQLGLLRSTRSGLAAVTALDLNNALHQCFLAAGRRDLLDVTGVLGNNDGKHHCLAGWSWCEGTCCKVAQYSRLPCCPWIPPTIPNLDLLTS